VNVKVNVFEDVCVTVGVSVAAATVGRGVLVDGGAACGVLRGVFVAGGVAAVLVV
jgi:hypothetical protein